MFKIRKNRERGLTQLDWLDSRHTFSFGDYYDPAHMRFRSLRVINEDRVAPAGGFPTHPHRDMEILTYVIAGAVEHKDSLGDAAVIRSGELQRMSAGTGVTHSEFNPSRLEPLHLLQIWILPAVKGLQPAYEQKSFPRDGAGKPWTLVASQDGREGSLTVHQDASLHLGRFEAGQVEDYRCRPDRFAWLQVVKGNLDLNGLTLEAGDAAAADSEAKLRIRAISDSEVLLFDLG